ncbi:MAG: TonB-dependent receptor plug domain-containing protein, partial [Bacteroidetes bacterium]|nr:TonB-dependent receptor plug domain-containing protein [Bacteroidota bacterium]
MRLIIVLFVALFATLPAHAQHGFVAIIKDRDTREPLAGAAVHIMGTAIGNSANADGVVVLSGIASGQQVLHVQTLGYKPQLDTLYFPLSGTDTLTVWLETDGKEMEEVVVSTTRSSRTIQDIPTRIELISGEELEEKGNMKPGDIRMLLAESTGIQTLQTSVTSANASIRMQGLDGRYTQILKDGFPLYAGFSGGLGLLQTPPLDLKQVEIIKGASSTLYGGGAIAGLINLISKTPAFDKELTFLVNGTSAGGLDINGFYSQRFGKFGITMFAARNSNAPYDPAGIGLTAIPKFERYTFNPKLFFYFNDKMDLMIGLNGSFENRMGGSIKYIQGQGDSLNSYFEDNQTQRISSQLEFKYKLSDGFLDVKNSFSYFNRIINMPNYTFDGT